jgi:hypothetical protein
VTSDRRAAIETIVRRAASFARARRKTALRVATPVRRNAIETIVPRAASFAQARRKTGLHAATSVRRNAIETIVRRAVLKDRPGRVTDLRGEKVPANGAISSRAVPAEVPNREAEAACRNAVRKGANAGSAGSSESRVEQ